MSEPIESGGNPVAGGHDVLFTQRMRAASKHIHRSSNNLVNLKLIIAFTSRERYGAALSLFYHVFQVLEEHMAALKDDPVLRQLSAMLPEFERAPAFKTDLAYLMGPQWRDMCKAPAEVRKYLDHLQLLRDGEPHLLLAHFYTQEAAMLAGGQIIRRMARKAMSLPEGSGTAVFEYKAVPSELQKGITAAVNRAAHLLSEQQREGMLKEHCRVFEFNNSIISGFQVGLLDWPRAAMTTAANFLPRSVVLGVASLTALLAAWSLAQLY